MACGQTAEPLRGRGIGGRLIVRMANTLSAQGLQPFSSAPRSGCTFIPASEKLERCPVLTPGLEDRPLGWDPVAAGNRAGDGMARFVSEEKLADGSS